MTTTVLALELGNTVGWAMRGRNDSIASGTVGFQPATYEGTGMRFVRFGRWLSELHAIVGGVHALYFEGTRNHPSIDAAHCYGGFVGQLTAWCETRSVPYHAVPVGKLKKHATGQGNATKEAMITAAQARGHRPFNGHEANALALLRWAIERRGGTA